MELKSFFHMDNSFKESQVWTLDNSFINIKNPSPSKTF